MMRITQLSLSEIEFDGVGRLVRPRHISATEWIEYWQILINHVDESPLFFEDDEDDDEEDDT